MAAFRRAKKQPASRSAANIMMKTKFLPVTVQNLCRSLNIRRQQLRMSYGALARRSHVSLPTVVRILSGQNVNASLANVAAIAESLGLLVKLEPTQGIADFREQQAQKKAQQLAGIVQGTSGLEAQALGESELNDLTRQTVHQLLAGSPRRLWDE